MGNIAENRHEGAIARVGALLGGHATLPDLLADTNDGIIATAGIVEGFGGAGAGDTTVVIAGFTAMLAGAMALAAAKYSEASVERDAEQALLEDERRRLALAPDEELAELVAHYEERGVSTEVARQVASELSARDALRAHAEAEYGISVSDPPTRPFLAALRAGMVCAIGSCVPLAAILLAPDTVRVQVTFVVVLFALALTATAGARMGGISVRRTVIRTVVIGAATMLMTAAIGSLVGL